MAKTRVSTEDTTESTVDTPNPEDYATTDPGAQQVEVYEPPVEGQPVDEDETLQTLINWCAAKVADAEEDAFEATKRIVRQTLAATNPDEVLREMLPISGKNFVDKPFLGFGFGITESEFTEGDGCPFYANLDIAVGNPPERRVVNIGSWRVMAQLMVLDMAGEWPQALVIRAKKRATRRGFYPLSLQRPE